MRKQQRREASKASNREETFRDDDDRLTKIHSPFHFILRCKKTCQFAMVLFCFDSCFHLTSIFLSCEIVEFWSEKLSNQIGIEN